MAVGDISVAKTIYPIQGLKIGVTKAHVRYADRRDLVVFELDEGTTTAVVTTQNQFCAAPVQIVRDHSQSPSRYLLINTGNANAATGEDGKKRALATCQALADKKGVDVRAVLPYSTGVIGETLPEQRIIAGLDDALSDLSADNWLEAAHGICTTDTIPKLDSIKLDLPDATYHITGISKGAGMIRPNMATMLGFVATDAAIAPTLLKKMLSQLTNLSFNRITIDGDTSTNDCCTLMATGGAGQEVIDSEDHRHYQALFDGLKQVFIRLATLIVRDGEGATKFITIKVTGGQNTQECADIAYSVAHSPLVKTAFFASDPNWGRILAAVGNAGVLLDQSRVNVSLDEINICERGGLAAAYTEEKGSLVMKRPEITVHIDLGRGQAADTVYTCDLSYDYVKINADYRS